MPWGWLVVALVMVAIIVGVVLEGRRNARRARWSAAASTAGRRADALAESVRAWASHSGEAHRDTWTDLSDRCGSVVAEARQLAASAPRETQQARAAALADAATRMRAAIDRVASTAARGTGADQQAAGGTGVDQQAAVGDLRVALSAVDSALLTLRSPL